MIEPTTDLISKPMPLSNRDWIALIGVFALTFAVYARTIGYGFINFDDSAYVYQNIEITSGFSLAALRMAMIATVNGNWHPLTTVTWLILASLFGVKAGAFHLTNSLLHAANAALLFAFLRKTTGRFSPALFVALFWALHPQRVESVAWVSELKDSLCGMMWLLCLLTYVGYSQQRTRGRYWTVIALFMLAICGKAMAITLPFVLLLLDYWPLQGHALSAAVRRQWWKHRIVEKLPLMMITGAAIVIGIKAQRRLHLGASLSIDPISMRLQNGLVSYCAYLRDAFVPYHLSLFYPHPSIAADAAISWPVALACAAVLLAISICAVAVIKSRPYFFVGWFWFLGTLVPVIGLFQSGPQARADRFTYLPAMGLDIAVVWLVAQWSLSRPAFRSISAVVGALAAIALTFATIVEINYWRDEPSLFTHMIAVRPDNFLALGIRADELSQSGRNAEALPLVERAVAIAPRDPASLASYGLILKALGRDDEAVHQLKLSLESNPWDSDNWDALGTVRDEQANDAETRHLPGEKAFRQQAINDFRNAFSQNPENIAAGQHLAVELALMGQMDEAITVWRAVIKVSPTFAQAQGDLADALRLRGDFRGAVEHYRAALAAGAKKPTWESQLAYLEATNPQATTADIQPMLAIAKDACDQTNNHDAGALDAYAACLARVGLFDAAVNAAQKGIAQADAAHAPRVAAGIQKRLAKYKKQMAWVAGDN